MTGITTHVLDLTRGTPGAGIRVTLRAAKGDVLTEAETDADGRAELRFVPERAAYRLTFDTGAYFRARGVEAFHPEVTVVFDVHDPAQHYHVPLLLSPFGYSTYRGS